MLDYAQLEALATVIRYGSFEKAARALRVTPSAVSQRVKALEENIGRVLVVRSQPCVATETGAALCNHVERVGLLEHELTGALPELRAIASPTVRIAVNADSAATWFVDAIADIARDHGVLFDLVIDDQDHTAELLQRGSVQAAVSSSSTPIRGCRVVKLGALRFIATCSPDFHKRYFSNGVTKEAMQRAPCLVFEPKDRLQHRFLRRITRADIEPPIHWIPNLHGFLQACIRGVAWCVQPENLAREQLQSGALVEFVPNKPVDIRLYWQSFNLQSQTMRAITDAVVRHAAHSLR